MRVSVLIPCFGRYHQILDLAPRLEMTAGSAYTLVCIVDGDPGHPNVPGATMVRLSQRGGYWTALRAGAHAVPADAYAYLANDLLPGVNWLRHAVAMHTGTFPDGDGAVGFWDGVWHGAHASHMLISHSTLTRWYGADLWPICYDHCAGDNELWDRAHEEQRLAVCPSAVLFHNHWRTGMQRDDIYALGRRHQGRDAALWNERKAQGWPPIS